MGGGDLVKGVVNWAQTFSDLSPELCDLILFLFETFPPSASLLDTCQVSTQFLLCQSVSHRKMLTHSSVFFLAKLGGVDKWKNFQFVPPRMGWDFQLLEHQKSILQDFHFAINILSTFNYPDTKSILWDFHFVNNNLQYSVLLVLIFKYDFNGGKIWSQ